MRYYVNLPLSWARQDKKWLELFARGSMHPELGFDEASLAAPLAWHRETACFLKDNGLFCAAHLPFFAPAPGSPSPALRAEAAAALCKAAEIAAIYGAAHMIGHPAFNPETDALPEGMFANRSLDFCPACQPAAALLSQDPLPSPQWIASSLETWGKVLAAGDTPLFLENTYDLSPVPVTSLLTALRRLAKDEGRAGMCFDIGHWFSFASGCKRENLRQWLEAIAPHLRHLHLHDNNGLADQHLGLGRGKIPLANFAEALTAMRLKPGVTLEPHTLEDFEHSLRWLAESPAHAVFYGGE